MMLNQQAMKDLKQLLLDRFSDQVERIILFGSQAQDHPPPDSDYDILIILKQPFDWKFRNRVYDATWEIDYKYDILTDIKLIAKQDLQTLKGKQPFIQNALHSGIVL